MPLLGGLATHKARPLLLGLATSAQMRRDSQVTACELVDASKISEGSFRSAASTASTAEVQ